MLIMRTLKQESFLFQGVLATSRFEDLSSCSAMVNTRMGFNLSFVNILKRDPRLATYTK